MIIVRILTFIISFLLLNLFTALFTLPITLIGLIKTLLPFKKGKLYCSKMANQLMKGWCNSLALILKLTNNVHWDVTGLNSLSDKEWYILIANHKSWLDIVVLCILFRKTIPMNKYFLKQQLIWVPFVGLACLALDMPFMRRYSRSYLIKHPEKRGRDIAATQRSCEKFKLLPTTVVNFIEGSRFTTQKKSTLNSPYHNLLAPKSAGIAFAINLLEKQCNNILNVTIDYPHNESNPFISLMRGELKTIVIRVENIVIPENLRGDYLRDKTYKRQFHLWLKALWQKKDEQLDEIKKYYNV